MSATFNGFGKKAIPFLKALGFHQSREWFPENRDLFERELREPFGDLIDVLTERFGAAGLGLTGRPQEVDVPDQPRCPLLQGQATVQPAPLGDPLA